jgi:hypothetical protein
MRAVWIELAVLGTPLSIVAHWHRENFSAHFIGDVDPQIDLDNPF